MTKNFLQTAGVALLLYLIFGIIYSCVAHHHESIGNILIIGPVVHLLTFVVYVFAVIQILRYYIYKRLILAFIFSVLLFIAGLLIFLLPIIYPLIGGVVMLTKYIGFIHLYDIYIGLLYGVVLLIYGFKKKEKYLSFFGISQLLFFAVDGVIFQYEYFQGIDKMSKVSGELTGYGIYLSLIFLYFNMKKDLKIATNSGHELIDEF